MYANVGFSNHNEDQVLDRNNFASCKAEEETLPVRRAVTALYLLLSLHYCMFTQPSLDFPAKLPKAAAREESHFIQRSVAKDA